MNIFASLTDQEDLESIRTEMEKRYDGSVLKITELKTKRSYLAKYWGYSDKKAFVFACPTLSTETVIPVETEDYEVSVYNPKIGLYMLKKENVNTLLFFNRSPYRQWSRGIHPKNSELSILINNGINPLKITKNFLGSLYPVLESEFRYNLKEALSIAKYFRECILNLNFGVTLHTTKKDAYLLWYHDCVIGEIEEKSNIISIVNPVFYQEVLDSISLFEGFDIHSADKQK